MTVSAEVSGSICSWAAKLARALVADRRKLSRKVVPGVVPVSDSVFLALPFNPHVQGKNALGMRESAT